MCFTPSLRSVPNVAFETVPMLFLIDNGPLSSFPGRSSSASSFHSSLLQAVDGVVPWLCARKYSSVSSSPTLDIFNNNNKKRRPLCNISDRITLS